VISINPALKSYNDDYTRIISRNTLQTARSPVLSSGRNQTPIVCYYELSFPITLQVFLHTFRPVLRPTQLLIKWAPVSFSGVKRLGRGFDHPLHLALRLKKEYS